MDIAGVTVTASDTLDPRVRARFVTHGARGSETTWLEITAPVEAFPSALADRLTAAGWTVPRDALVAPEPAVSIDEERDAATGYVVAWQRVNHGYEQVSVPFLAETTTPTSEQVKAARQALRYFGISRTPTTSPSWRDLV